ncbi:MAG: peroxidase [Myxococcales bacterium]|nr:hypothetical protein [Myxococcales bacterium]MCB9751132.1 peroxidase [Myxococcales bacterium]
MTDYRAAALTRADRAMLDYASKLTLRPGEVTRDDVERLRAAGFDDAAIHHVAQITALFAYYNRVVDGLGGAAEPEW